MKRKFWKQFVRYVFYTCTFLGSLFWANSCKDDYIYDDKEPEWLGANIFDYLNSDGHYTYYVRLIKETGNEEVLARTGSKTVFVANDDAFNRFFENNVWGVKTYNGLSEVQKRILFNFSIINNAYLIETLSNYNVNNQLVEGVAMRRESSVSIFDTLSFDIGDGVPTGSIGHNYWAPYKEKGIHMFKDYTSWPFVFFLQKQLSYAKISNDDFKLITGVSRVDGDAHIFNIKIIAKDIVCKNGYVHILQDVLIPPKNMAEYIFSNPQISTFSQLLHRFSAPYYVKSLTDEYKSRHNEFNDSVFIKAFFNNQFNSGLVNVIAPPTIVKNYPDGKVIDKNIFLPFNPEYNLYQDSKPYQVDFAAMFVPTNDALATYFNDGIGVRIKNRYGTWENTPDDIIALLVRQHMRKSFLESLPASFENLTDDNGYKINIKKTDKENSYVALNGWVFVHKTVLSPPDFQTVFAPVLFSDKAKIFKYIISFQHETWRTDYRMYLNSLENEFSLLVPSDEFFAHYVDPVTLPKLIPGALVFFYNENSKTVNAKVYKYDVNTKTLGDSVETVTDQTFINNRLYDILNSHIVIGNIESGRDYFLTKNGNVLKVSGAGTSLKIEGGGNMENGQVVNVVSYSNELNGKTYFIDKPIETPYTSLYEKLSSTPEFLEFFKLMDGFDKPSKSASNAKMFVAKDVVNYWGIDYNLKFLNTYNYTLYIPTNEAIIDAMKKGNISPWETQDGVTGINQMDATSKAAAIAKLEKFIRYHFQDNSILIGNYYNTPFKYTSAARKTDYAITGFNTSYNKYYRLKPYTDKGNDLSIVTETLDTAKVNIQGGLYNILVRDYVFGKDPSTCKEIDKSGTGTNSYYQTSISTSYTTVIHQIDKVLLFQ